MVTSTLLNSPNPTMQLTVMSRAIGQGADGFSLAIALQGDDQFSGAHINAGENNGGLFHEWI